MKPELSSSVPLRRLFISMTLAASLVACGGDSSSSRSTPAPGPAADVLLDETTQFLVIGRSILILTGALNMPISLALAATDMQAEPFSLCGADEYDLETSAAGISVDYDCEHTDSHDNLSPLGHPYPERENTTQNATGKATLNAIDADSGEAFFDEFVLEVHSFRENWNAPWDGTSPPDSTTESETRFYNHGHIAWQAGFPHTADLTSHMEMSNALDGGPATSFKLRYSVRDLSSSGNLLNFFLTLHEADGDIATELKTLQPLNVTSPDQCPSAGWLEWTDADGNVLNVLFGGTHGVVMTLNGDANTLPCDEFETAMATVMTF